MPTPSARQLEYLQFIAAYTKRYGMPPAFEDMADHFLISLPSVHSMMKTLESKGFLARVPGAARSLRVLYPLEEPKRGRPASAPPPPRPSPPPAPQPGGAAASVDIAVRLASLVVARLPKALDGLPQPVLWRCFQAVADALELLLKDVRISNEERERAMEHLVRAARAAEHGWKEPPRKVTHIWVLRPPPED